MEKMPHADTAAADDDDTCIDARHISKVYGRTSAVDDVTFRVQRGRIFGFLGPNGAGKSTTIKMLTTLVRPTSGDISILGIDAMKSPLQVRQRIGVVLQQPSYEPTLSVEKALDKYGMMWGVPRGVRRDRTESLLEEFDLAEVRGRRNEDLSIGQRRRVQVAREFMHDMDLLFLDEPTVGLDPSARRDLLDYLQNRVRETGLSIFYTTHILTEAEYLCDEIAIMNRGRLLEVDTPDALKAKLGDEKTIKIHLPHRPPNIRDLLSGMDGCRIEFGGDRRTTVTIRSSESELVLLRVLGILHENRVEIEDLSAVPTSLEEIFLNMTEELRGQQQQQGGPDAGAGADVSGGGDGGRRRTGRRGGSRA